MKFVVLLLTAAGVLFGICCAQAQVASAFRLVNLSAGAEYSNLDPGYGPNRMSGVGAYADLELFFGLSAEAEARFLRFDGFHGEGESTYLIGPRYTLLHLGPVRPYVKVLAGGGQIDYPDTIGHGSYAAYEGAAGVDLLAGRHWKVRGEYEYQYWPSAPGGFYSSDSGSYFRGSLQPNGASLGLGYRF